jgi:acetyl-CoA synthetase
MKIHNSINGIPTEAANRFWQEQSRLVEWISPFSSVSDVSFTSPVHIRWFEDGELNVCYNCVDRHALTQPDKTALIWEGNDPNTSRYISFAELKRQVSKLANILLSLEVKKGDRIVIYMPMIPEAVYAMLACTRIGAVHSVVFGGFSPASLAQRINDCGATIVITADYGVRGDKRVPLKANVDAALAECDTVKHVLMVRHTGEEVAWNEARDHAYEVLMEGASDYCPCAAMNAEDPLFILYTSGSTGKPKGIMHTTGGYLVYATYTFAHIFDVQPTDVHWCSADIGWITGHSYAVYGPLSNGTTSLIFEGVPSYPDYDRFWQVIDTHRVTIFYTAPTVLRSLMKQGDHHLESSSRDSLRVLGSVGEPINPEAWHWLHQQVGNGRAPVVDTWWQTETGGILISATALDNPNKAGCATKPLPTIVPCLLDGQGSIVEGAGEGALCMKASWPGQARSIYGDHHRFEQTYFSPYAGYYFSGDGAARDEQGDFWITGRMDDVLNVSGHRLGTAEIEAALNEHDCVVETAIVGIPHAVKGQGICAFVILKEGYTPYDALPTELNELLRRLIGAIATIDIFHFVEDLPKTRSGKIMRRILRKIAEGSDDFGDISTLADPSVIAKLLIK